MSSRRFTNYPEPRYVKTAEIAKKAKELDKKLSYKDVFPTFDFSGYLIEDSILNPTYINGLYEFVSDLSQGDIIVGLNIRVQTSIGISENFNSIMYYNYETTDSWSGGEGFVFDVRDLCKDASDGFLKISKNDQGQLGLSYYEL